MHSRLYMSCIICMDMYLCFNGSLPIHNSAKSCLKFLTWNGGLYSHAIRKHTHRRIGARVRAAVWFLTLPKCFYGSFVVKVYGLS